MLVIIARTSRIGINIIGTAMAWETPVTIAGVLQIWTKPTGMGIVLLTVIPIPLIRDAETHVTNAPMTRAKFLQGLAAAAHRRRTRITMVLRIVLTCVRMIL